MTRWSEISKRGDPAGYQARFDRLAAAGHDVHGEADLCTRLLPTGSTVLDAGCGTGRVAVELDRRGYLVVGVDIDERMIAHARAIDSGVAWFKGDLANLDLANLDSANFERFGLVISAGNVIPLVAAGSEPQVMANLAGAVETGGLLVTGFGLDAEHLPLPEAPFGLDEYDVWCEATGLGLLHRYSTWDGAAYDGGGYVVNVHTK